MKWSGEKVLFWWYVSFELGGVGGRGGASFVAQLVKNPPAMRETWVPSLGWKDPLEKEKATHSSILAWRISWTVQSMGSQRVRHNSAPFTFTFIISSRQPNPTHPPCPLDPTLSHLLSSFLPAPLFSLKDHPYWHGNMCSCPLSSKSCFLNKTKTCSKPTSPTNLSIRIVYLCSHPSSNPIFPQTTSVRLLSSLFY